MCMPTGAYAGSEPDDTPPVEPSPVTARELAAYKQAIEALLDEHVRRASELKTSPGNRRLIRRKAKLEELMMGLVELGKLNHMTDRTRGIDNPEGIP